MLELNRNFWPKIAEEISRKRNTNEILIATNIDFLPILPLFFEGKNNTARDDNEVIE